MYNKAFLIGRLVRDPEMRLTSSGISVTTFTIAINRPTRKDEEKGADFIRIVAWRRLAEICNEYLKKGKLVAVDGRLQFSSYEKDGEKRYSAEIIADNMQMLDRGTDVLESEHGFGQPVSG
jgi:single-strand DNA-binding protein